MDLMKDRAFEALVRRARACRLCASMAGRRRVLGCANGAPGARVLFVGEAPGRYGADRTDVPFHGDRSGQRFERLLGVTGWSRGEVFVTNAVLCNPRSADGRNRSPNHAELANCRRHLVDTIEVVGPRVVVALGGWALRALAAVHPHQLSLREDVGRPVAWRRGVWLTVLYHPGARATVHRSDARQEEDWRRLRAFVDGLGLVGESGWAATTLARPSAQGTGRL
jgi:uracil-DNA glycosylase family 4